MALVTLALLIFADAQGEAATTVVGAIGGRFSATPTGQAAYVIPLPAPGGAGGLSPSLSLEYVGNSGPGLLGWDMTVGGLSAITRCPSTWPYDGSTAPVNLTSRDRFCLDGQELTLQGGTYGHNGATYLTTPTAHMLVTSETSNDNLGPQWFKVRHPDGSTWEYGRLNHSEVTATNASGQTVGRLWALDAITDASGNTVTFHYTQPGGTGAYYVSEVDWGGNSNAGTTADHSMVFTYSAVGADASRFRYVAGNQIIWNRRLTKITLEYNSAATLTWTPTYLADGQGSNRTRLSSIKECDANDLHCLHATSFQWQQGSVGYGPAQNSGDTGPADDTAFVADVNGDGLKDLVYDRGGVWRVRFGVAGGGFGAENSTGVSVVNESYAQPIHYAPGAGDQILVENGSHDWDIVSWDSGSSTFASTDKLTSADGVIAVTGPAAVADVNGDGYDDLVTYSGADLIVRLNTALNSQSQSGGFGAPQTAYSLTGTAPGTNDFVGFRGIGASGARGPARALHFVRAGAGVVARVYHSETICFQDGCPPGSRKRTITNWHDRAFVWTGSGFSTYGTTFAGSSAGSGGGEVFPLDVNGDGLTDLMLSGSATLLLNDGTTFRSKPYGYSTSGLNLDRAVAADYSGNGRDDVLVPNSTTGDWTRLPSSGTTLGAAVGTGVASGNFGAHPVVADTEGRMLDDLIGVGSSGDIEFSLRNGDYPDEVTRITDGLGNYHALSWVPLSDANVVTGVGPGGAQYELTRRGPYVLASVQANNGIGGSYTLSYGYQTPKRIAGAGFSQMALTTQTDSRTGDVTTTDWGANLFAVGLPAQITVAQGNGDLLQKETYLRDVLATQEPEVLRKWQTVKDDLTGNALERITRVYSYDGDDEPTEVKVTTTNNTNGKVWVNDTTLAPAEGTTGGNWCYGLVSTKTVSDTLPSGANSSRETDYDTDLSHCRVNSMTTNAGAATQLKTTETLTYDNYGNIAKDTIVGHRPDGSTMTPRVTQSWYNAPSGATYNDGEFQTKLTDAAGDITQMDWNGALGVQTSQTAPSGSITTSLHDGFGRLKKVMLPTGANTVVSYHACSGSACNSCSVCTYYRLSKITDANGRAAGESYRYYDRYGRTYEQATERLGGQLAHVVTRYNAQGQVQERSAPYYSGETVYWTQYGYDALGRMHEIVAPNSTSGTTTTTISYSGYTATVSGPGGYTRTVTKNPLGQVTQVTNADGKTSSYAYAPFAELTQVTGPDPATTTLQYDAAGHRTQLSGPDRGTLRFQFNSLGAPVSETNARGQAISIGYDTLGRMTQRSFPNPSGSGTEIQQWHYAASGNGTGRLASESDNKTGFSRTLGNYNVLGEPTSLQETLDGVLQTLTLGYDSLGRITSVTYPVSVGGHALQVDYHYDTSGNLDKVSNANDGTVYWQPQSGGGFPAMNALGQMEAYVLGGGLDVERLHDAATGQVTSITSGPNGSGSVLNLTTSYNAKGSRQTLDDLNAGLYQAYQYDALQRLKKVTRSGSAGDSASSFSYYAAGQFNQGPAGSYSYAGSPVAHSPSSTTQGGMTTDYGYNADGERTMARLPQVTWDALGKARSVRPQQGVNPIDLTYGPDGGLVNTTGSEGWRYLGSFLKWRDANNWSARVVVQGKVIAVVKNESGSVSTSYLLQGPLGSTQATATGSGSLTQRIAYGAWGGFVHADTGTGSVSPSTIANYTTVTYTGHEVIAGAGLINMGARLYDPATGLFMSPDPTVAHPYDTQDMNQYAYVGDNPLSFVDPYGYWAEYMQPYLDSGSNTEFAPTMSQLGLGALGVVQLGVSALGFAAIAPEELFSLGYGTPIAILDAVGSSAMGAKGLLNIKNAITGNIRSEDIPGDKYLNAIDHAKSAAQFIGAAPEGRAVIAGMSAASFLTSAWGSFFDSTRIPSPFSGYRSIIIGSKDGSSTIIYGKPTVGPNGVITIVTKSGTKWVCDKSGCRIVSKKGS